MNLSVIGLGKLGSPAAAVFAASGHYVIGVDVNPSYVQAITLGRAPVDEPLLQDMIDTCGQRLTATMSYDYAILSSDVSFVIVPTPSQTDGTFTNDYVVTALEQIGAALRKKDGYHVVAITSTVMPGATGGSLTGALERASGRRVGFDLGLCYNPEFIALGSVVHDMLYPDFTLIGESDLRSGDIVAEVYAVTCPQKPPVRRMNFVNAELTKIALNTFVTTKISYANMLAEICDKLPGADVDVVSDALGSDSRIGRKYLTGATGYGGPCFPRDNVAFSRVAEQLGAAAYIAVATDKINNHQIGRLMSIIRDSVPKSATVTVLGLSYKPETDVVECSHGVELADSLLAAGYRVAVHDPSALEPARRVLDERVSYTHDLFAALADAEVIVIMTPWPIYSTISPEALSRSQTKVVVIDCWRVLDRSRFAAIVDLRWIGYGPEADALRSVVRA